MHSALKFEIHVEPNTTWVHEKHEMCHSC